jgi:hypothetical protein
MRVMDITTTSQAKGNTFGTTLTKYDKIPRGQVPRANYTEIMQVATAREEKIFDDAGELAVVVGGGLHLRSLRCKGRTSSSIYFQYWDI